MILAIETLSLDPLERVDPTRLLPVSGPHVVIQSGMCVYVCVYVCVCVCVCGKEFNYTSIPNETVFLSDCIPFLSVSIQEAATRRSDTTTALRKTSPGSATMFG